MKTRLLLAVGILVACAFLFGQKAVAQDTVTVQHDGVEAQIDTLRADLKANREEIVRQALQLQPAVADSFWPVYMQYEHDLTPINDDLVALVKNYAAKFGTITNADAQAMTLKMFAIQEQKIQLKQKYFPIFTKATSAFVAAKFFQTDYRIELAFNVKLASELPALFTQSTPAPAPTKGN